ncbi:zymogen granule membrane protein 16-like [Alosa sapidissima]|uniref:zymogen granule membrane protein 16-like n=1 Tax=Alosa sapidissima TaxID=34773 RepID=UPI001C0919E2|nr:zymogen granule membrane protein 16-like [Alosa sapidissima]XP_041934169.1 zymogen granule membrane protein 16-like [Alosa sapidissima]
MFALLALCLLCSSAWAQHQTDRYSFSETVGSGTGTRYATPGTGRITAVRMWEQNNNIVTGFQLKYGFAWSPQVGPNTTNLVEMSLFKGEAIAQVSGKYIPSNFISLLQFVTNMGRVLAAGQPQGLSFSHYGTNSESELRILSGRASRAGITSLGAHFDSMDDMRYETHGTGNTTTMVPFH